MRRRLEIARGLVHNPHIFFLDEPTTGLDPVSRIAVWEMLDNLRKTRNLTMLLTTHYMEEADKLCDRIAIVDHGNLVALGTPIELKQNVPGANVVEVHFDRETDEWKSRLESMGGVTSVQAESAGFYRVLTSSGSKTTMQLVEFVLSDAIPLRPAKRMRALPRRSVPHVIDGVQPTSKPLASMLVPHRHHRQDRLSCSS
jgi:ABC-2 type transport system ATP-binding protein